MSEMHYCRLSCISTALYTLIRHKAVIFLTIVLLKIMNWASTYVIIEFVVLSLY